MKELTKEKAREMIENIEKILVLDDEKRKKLELLYLYSLIAEHYPEVKDGARFYVTTQKKYRKNYSMMSSQARFVLQGIGLWDKTSDDIVIVKIKEQGYKYGKGEYVLVKPKAELNYFKENSERVISFGEPKK